VKPLCNTEDLVASLPGVCHVEIAGECPPALRIETTSREDMDLVVVSLTMLSDQLTWTIVSDTVLVVDLE
jgi:hypothetical protein